MPKYPRFSFQISHKTPSSRARIGLLSTPHGTINTPNFIFCATKGAIKGASPRDLREIGAEIILSNTYHLMLQPGEECVEALGGLQQFTGWRAPMLTDSGGFQIFSLGHGSVAEEVKGKRNHSRPKTLLDITEEGARFKSYLDGKLHLLTPEKSIQVQRQLGADLIVSFDECTPFHVDKAYTQKSLALTHRWGVRSLQEFERGDDGRQALYGIIQGGVYPDLRQEAADFVNSHPFFAHAIGGSLGANKEQMYEVVSFTAPLLDATRPIHLLGIGGIRDIFKGVRYGIDTFDCVHPTRLARHGGALVKPGNWKGIGNAPKEHLNIRNQIFEQDQSPLDSTCDCRTCQTFSRGYLHHLFKAKELLGIQALTLHNLRFMVRLMTAIRQAIQSDTLDQLESEWVSDERGSTN